MKENIFKTLKRFSIFFYIYIFIKSTLKWNYKKRLWQAHSVYIQKERVQNMIMGQKRKSPFLKTKPHMTGVQGMQNWCAKNKSVTLSPISHPILLFILAPPW